MNKFDKLFFPALIIISGCTRSYENKAVMGFYEFDGEKLNTYACYEYGEQDYSPLNYCCGSGVTATRIKKSSLYKVSWNLWDDNSKINDCQIIRSVMGETINLYIKSSSSFVHVNTGSQHYDLKEYFIGPTIAPQGNYNCKLDGNSFKIYKGYNQDTLIDEGEGVNSNLIHFTWSGEFIYFINNVKMGEKDYIGSVYYSKIGSHGKWDRFVYDSNMCPIDMDDGSTYLYNFDLLDGQGVALIKKFHHSNNEKYGSSSYAIYMNEKIISKWIDDTLIPTILMRPDLKCVLFFTNIFQTFESNLHIRDFKTGNVKLFHIDCKSVIP